jgi:hypothetical protein
MRRNASSFPLFDLLPKSRRVVRDASRDFGSIIS